MTTQGVAGEKRSRTSMGELLGAFAFASDLAFGLKLEDSLRSTYLAMRLAQHMGLPKSEQHTVYYTSLLKDAGCTPWTGELARSWQTDEIVARRELYLFTDRSTYSGIDAWMRQHVAIGLPQEVREDQFREVLANMPQLIADAVANTAEVSGRIAQGLGMPPAIQEAMYHMFE